MPTHFRQAISVRYSGPTNTRGSKMIATSASGHRIMHPYEHGLDVAENAAQAAKALARKLGWKGVMVGGGTKDGFVFVFDAGAESRVENPMRRRYPPRGKVPKQLRRYLFKRKGRR